MTGTYWIETWGCQMNEHDSEKMAGSLEGLGYAPAASAPDADVVLLNTCAIREKAEEKVYQFLEKLRPARAANDGMIVGVCGCVAQLQGQGIRDRLPFVDLVLGPRASGKLPEYLARAKDRRGIVDTTLYQDSILAGTENVRRQPGRVKAYVTVMEGCNKTCTYCVVPATRGREESRPLEALLGEVRRLAGEGYPEVEFLGQNVNAWRCPATKAHLGDLLRAAGRVAGIRRIRFTTSHPLHLSEDILRAMAEVPEICDALHLPVQSGSARVLKAMRRGYDAEKYLAKAEEIRKWNPGVALSTDVIVGFPGETEAEFAETLALVRHVRFDQMFSFVYSPRPNTVASMLRDDVPAERKSERLAELQALQREIQLERHRALVGRTFEVLVEGRSRRREEEYAGRTTCNRMLNFPSARPLAAGDVVRVKATWASPVSLRGERDERAADGGETREAMA